MEGRGTVEGESEGEKGMRQIGKGREEADQKARLRGTREAPHLHFQNEEGVFLGKICSAFKSSLLEWPRIFQKTFLCSRSKAPLAQALIRFLWGDDIPDHSPALDITLLIFQIPTAGACAQGQNPPGV